jgi:hypothetical protein
VHAAHQHAIAQLREAQVQRCQQMWISAYSDDSFEICAAANRVARACTS